MRESIVNWDILPAFQNRLLNEITADDLRALCGKVKERGAPATAVHIPGPIGEWPEGDVLRERHLRIP